MSDHELTVMSGGGVADRSITLMQLPSQVGPSSIGGLLINLLFDNFLFSYSSILGIKLHKALLAHLRHKRIVFVLHVSFDICATLIPTLSNGVANTC